MSLRRMTIFELLLDIYDEEGALIWLRSRNRLLENQRPIEMTSTPEGTEQVRQLLQQLAHGNF
jgi:uncharacterized protein (DUF2384 family)